MRINWLLKFRNKDRLESLASLLSCSVSQGDPTGIITRHSGVKSWNTETLSKFYNITKSECSYLFMTWTYKDYNCVEVLSRLRRFLNDPC